MNPSNKVCQRCKYNAVCATQDRDTMALWFFINKRPRVEDCPLEDGEMVFKRDVSVDDACSVETPFGDKDR